MHTPAVEDPATETGEPLGNYDPEGLMCAAALVLAKGWRMLMMGGGAVRGRGDKKMRR